ncbi:alpha amylase C-terminal domain-containing protein [Nostoc parmelioides]|uniref:Alpha amylase C-terminal domain-containing protein n=1 Tax=Nostoc parmelioides FACHB-3921 TaxID=2692909 RepID=A0ABR8BCN6_9NOSO|nr:alpha amylase C-terminal domain-containing protein [Nostoc parmelioides]MBD2251484.1 alpha amylase C-terminal domain-containing protein [Nostoc parmelioides FACHB-3921]
MQSQSPSPEHWIRNTANIRTILEDISQRIHLIEKKNNDEIPLQQWHSGYIPSHITHISRIFQDGTIDLDLIIYLPKNNTFSNIPETYNFYQELDVQVRVGYRNWQSLNPPRVDFPYWSLQLEKISPGKRMAIRYKNSQGNWQLINTIGEIEQIYGLSYVPNPTYQWKNNPPKYSYAKVLMETTLEGLLAGYKNGKYAPNNIADLLQISIAKRIINTDIPERLADLGVDEILVPVWSSVADRSHLDPKFNYLIYNIGNIDWQIGNTSEFKCLVDRLYANGIQIVPDLIFAHQVKSPFSESLDQIELEDSNNLFVDRNPFLFRDYGTWMFNLADPKIREILIEKIVFFVKTYRFHKIRIDYIDGLILQYANRSENFGEKFIRELNTALRQAVPEIMILGEAFETSINPTVREFIDIFYAPRGFMIVEELYKPPSRMQRPLYPDISPLIEQINQANQTDRCEAIYAQLHDETWYCHHIANSRPHVPWAYGANPAQLAKNQGEELVIMQLLAPENLLDFVRRTVRNAEVFTMFLANQNYMFVHTVDSLALGRLDEVDRWKSTWEDINPQDILTWKKTGLSERKIYHIHAQHRIDMVEIRKIFRLYTDLNKYTHEPLFHTDVYYCDRSTSLLALFRRHLYQPEKSLVIVFNFGPQAFRHYLHYELPAPEGFEGKWQVLFDGDWNNYPSYSLQQAQYGYAPHTLFHTTNGTYSNLPHIFKINIGGRSLIILKYCP